MTFCHHLRLIGNSVGDRKAIELWQMIEYKILNTEALPPWLEINLQPLGLWKHTGDLKTSDDLEKDLGQKLANGCKCSIKTTLNSEMHDNSTCSWRVLSKVLFLLLLQFGSHPFFMFHLSSVFSPFSQSENSIMYWIK